MKNKKKIIIILTILIISIVLAAFIGYKLHKKEVTNDEVMYLSADEIVDLLTYIPYSTINSKFYQSAYCGDKVTSKDILPVILSPILVGDQLKFYTKEDAYFEKKLNEHNIGNGVIYLSNDLENYLMKRYNLKINDLVKSSDSRVKVVELDDKYTVFSTPKGDNFSILFHVLISVNEGYILKGDAIITEKVLFYEFKDNKYYVYKNSNATDNDIIKVYDKKDSNGKELSYEDIFNKIKEDFQDYNYGFKHTFKKNKTGYYWYSTELIELK